jgi:hypothetical protein
VVGVLVAVFQLLRMWHEMAWALKKKVRQKVRHKIQK